MMKATAIAAATLLALAGFGAQGVRAEICLDFTEFTDGLEITIKGNRITGVWVNVDGPGSEAPIEGVIRDGLPVPCSPPDAAKAGIACIWDRGCEGEFENWDWYFLLDGLDGTLDFGSDFDEIIGPPGACGIDDLPYEIILGPCPFGPDSKGSEPGITLQQAVRARLEQQ